MGSVGGSRQVSPEDPDVFRYGPHVVRYVEQHMNRLLGEGHWQLPSAKHVLHFFHRLTQWMRAMIFSSGGHGMARHDCIA